MFAQRKNSNQKNPREISGTNAYPALPMAHIVFEMLPNWCPDGDLCEWDQKRRKPLTH